MLLSALLLVQCADDEYLVTDVPVWKPVIESFSTQTPEWNSEVGTPSNISPEWVFSLIENDTMPEWEAPDQNLYPGSMTAIIRLTPYLERYIADDDKMVAMIGNECHGLAIPTIIDGKYYFFIQIKAASEEQGDIVFKYYSTKNRKLYFSVEKVPYRIDKIYGTSQTPVFLDFESSGKFPFYMNVFFQPNSQIVPFEVQQGDKIAAFADNECRGSATLNLNNSDNKIFNFEIRGKEADEPVVIKYYSNATKMIYQSEEKFQIEHRTQKGTETTPVKFGIIPENGIVAYVFIPEIFNDFATDKDLVALFASEECRGVYSERLTVNGKNVYRIPARISPNEKAEFKYYNAKLKYIFSTGNNLLYNTISSFGSPNVPKELPLLTSACHPVRMNAVFEIHHDLLNNISENDILAAFVNDECRGEAKFVENNGKKIFEVEINGSLFTNEKVSIRYYNASLKYQFESVKSFDFVPEGSFGSIDTPVVIELKIIEN